MYVEKGGGECGILLLNIVFMIIGNYFFFLSVDNRNNYFSKRK